MILLLDIILFLAFLSTIAVDILTRKPWGPEGPIGAWLLLVIPCLFAAILVFVMAGKGLLNFFPGGRMIQFVIAMGMLIVFSMVLFGRLGRHDSMSLGGLMVAPYLILAGCAAIIHCSNLTDSRVGYWVATIVFGGTALTGWGLSGWGVFLYLQADMQQSAQKALEEREQEDQNKQWEAAEYAKLDDSSSLYAFLDFMWSRNEEVRRQAQEKVNRFPGLDDELVRLLDLDSKGAVSYIAKLYENPPAKLAPAWGRMLERQLKKWSSLQYDEHAGTWENNLKPYFVGAQKIQLAGGSLHTELQSWYTYLQKCKGLGNLAAFVKNLLETESQSQ